MRSLVGLKSLVLAAALVLPGVAHAAWPVNPCIDLGKVDHNGILEAHFVPGAHPGEWISYFFQKSGNFGGWAATTFNVDGQVAWPGLPRGFPGGREWTVFSEYGAGFAPDGQGGLLHLFHGPPSGYGYSGPDSLYLQRMNPAGVLDPSTFPFGRAIAECRTCGPAGAGADSGGAYLAWNVYDATLTRVDANGAVVAPWPAEGVTVGTSENWETNPVALLSDGANGVLVFRSTWSRTYVHRFDANATPHAGWPAGGLALETARPSSLLLFETWPRLVRADASHFCALWTESAVSNGPVGRVYAQRFTVDGALDPAWPVGAIDLTAGGPPVSNFYGGQFQGIPDGSGGITAVWADSSGYWARHVRADGTFESGYEAGPRLIVAASAAQPGWFGRPLAAVTAGRNGGLCAFYSTVNFTSVRGRWLDAHGALDPSPATGECEVLSTADQLASGCHYGHVVGALADGEGGAYLIGDGSAPSSDQFYPSAILSHVVQRSLFLDAGHAPSPTSLSLAVSPNPVHGEFSARFTLPDETPARLELLDLAGRLVRSHDVIGAGAHTERFDGVSELPPGVYLMRLARGAESRVARVAIVR